MAAGVAQEEEEPALRALDTPRHDAETYGKVVHLAPD